MRPAKHNLAVGLLIALFLAGSMMAADKPNFSGEWNLNVAKSDFGQMPAPTKSVMKVDHKDPVLKVATTSTSERGERTFEAEYSTEGKETVNKMFGDNEIKNTAKWDGAALLIDGKANFNGNDITMKQKWTLSDDGKVLTIERTFSSSQGEGTTKQIYEKK